MGMKGKRTKKVAVRGRPRKPKPPASRVTRSVATHYFYKLEPKVLTDCRCDGAELAKLLNLAALHPAHRIGLLGEITKSLRSDGLQVSWRVRGLSKFQTEMEIEDYENDG